MLGGMGWVCVKRGGAGAWFEARHFYLIKLIRAACYMGRFCFCPLHAHMWLAEALVKPMFALAIASNRVPALNKAFKEHLGLDNMFAEVQSDQGTGKVWKPISFKAFECHLFTLSAVEKVLHQVWPDHDEPQAESASKAKSCTSASKAKPGGYRKNKK
jgi:hypothetical protein